MAQEPRRFYDGGTLRARRRARASRPTRAPTRASCSSGTPRRASRRSRSSGAWPTSTATSASCWCPADAGFRTDLTSVPALFTWLVPKTGAHLPAALLHDALVAGRDDPTSYVSTDGHEVDRVEADRIFRDAMADTGTGVIRRWIVWTAVTVATIFVGRAVPWSPAKHWSYRVAAAVTIVTILYLGYSSTSDLFDRSWVGAVDVPWMGDRLVVGRGRGRAVRRDRAAAGAEPAVGPAADGRGDRRGDARRAAPRHGRARRRSARPTSRSSGWPAARRCSAGRWRPWSWSARWSPSRVVTSVLTWASHRPAKPVGGQVLVDEVEPGPERRRTTRPSATAVTSIPWTLRGNRLGTVRTRCQPPTRPAVTIAETMLAKAAPMTVPRRSRRLIRIADVAAAVAPATSWGRLRSRKGWRSGCGSGVSHLARGVGDRASPVRRRAARIVSRREQAHRRARAALSAGSTSPARRRRSGRRRPAR